MQEHHPEIESLKLAIEAKAGGKLATPADFSLLTAMIERETGCHVGLTTVKRLWGYIDCSSRLRDGTLSIFARFVGRRHSLTDGKCLPQTWLQAIFWK